MLKMLVTNISIMLALALTSGAALAKADNPYNLLRESQYSQRLVTDIKLFWEKTAQSGSFTGVGELNLAYLKFIHDQEKAAIVISSGRTESYIKYKELIYELYLQGYSVYIHDHRGQGFSDRLITDNKHKGHVDKFENYVTDLNTFVNQVVKKNSHKKLFLLSHSMGGAIATRYIQTFPQVFDAAALSSPMHAPDARIYKSPEAGCWWFKLTAWACKECYAGFKNKPYDPPAFNNNEYSHSELRYQEFRKAYAENPATQIGGSTRQWVKEACTVSSDLLENTNKIVIPVLVLQAGEDTAVTPEAQNEFCKNLKQETDNTCYQNGPIKYPGAYHELFIEADQYRIPALSKILEFFSTIEKTE